jgi:hypothetical protein
MPDLQPCGTHGAYARHLRNGEPPCDPCRAAHAAVCAANYEARKLDPAPRELMPCGTDAAARRHWRRGEPLDEACKQASRRAKIARTGRDHIPNADSPDYREIRNGIPFRPYVYRGTGRDIYEDEDVAS